MEHIRHKIERLRALRPGLHDRDFLLTWRQPDEAMLAGLLHGIGGLYILTQTQRLDPAMRADPDFQAVLQDWQPRLGKAILDTLAASELIDRGDWEGFRRLAIEALASPGRICSRSTPTSRPCATAYSAAPPE